MKCSDGQVADRNWIGDGADGGRRGEFVEYLNKPQRCGQQHAAVELCREPSRKNPAVGLERQRHGFRQACQTLGVVMPENVEALIVPDRQFPGKDS